MLGQIVLFLGMLVVSASALQAQGNIAPINGTITAIEGDHIQIKDQAGKSVVVMLQKNTKYLKSEKPATKADLKIGVPVLIHIKMDEKMKMYAAETVTISTP